MRDRGDCDNVTMRDRLPDLLHDRLAASARADVQAHVNGCAECRAELELLRSVMAGATAPRVDTSRISAQLRPYRRPSVWASAAHSWPLRAAAGIVLLVGAASVIRDRASNQPDTVVAVASSAELSVGGLTDIPESDLRALVDELGKLEAVTSSEPEVVVVPAVGRSSGGGGK
jgi:hypothetical protein